MATISFALISFEMRKKTVFQQETWLLPTFYTWRGWEEVKLEPTGAGTSEVGMASRWGRCSSVRSRTQ